MEENSKEKEKREKATPKHKLYNFILSPYFMRKETGIPISSPDAKFFIRMKHIMQSNEKLCDLCVVYESRSCFND